ncbi:MAG TPA: YtxH domain-containing protein [Candidatus Limnocylindrales bacterium]|nr:YtxH domain-containing protein [Candidatus Limnocylindrales bacterium]
MDHKENNHHNQNGNGFMLGLILGSAAALLFTTKKGREILSDLTEKGLEKFSTLQDNLDKKIIKEVEENDYLEPEERAIEHIEIEKPKLLAKEEVKHEKSHNTKPEIVHSPKPQRTVKRLFRLKKN